MANEYFSIDGSREVLKLIEEGGRKAGLGRGHAFEDFLTLVVCALAGQTLEEEYLSVVRKGYDKGVQGKRGIDNMTQAFAEMVNVMKDGFVDVLGDIYQGAITYGEAGQFFTPTSISELMAALVTTDQHQATDEVAEQALEGLKQSDNLQPDNSKENSVNEEFKVRDGNPEYDDEPKSICDPACGSGRILLSIAKEHPNWEFTGQDVDPRCAKMTAINLGLHGLRGWSVWQNSLTLETYRVFKIGLNLRGGVIKEVPVAASPFNYAAKSLKQSPKSEAVWKREVPEKQGSNKPAGSQLDLF